MSTLYDQFAQLERGCCGGSNVTDTQMNLLHRVRRRIASYRRTAYRQAFARGLFRTRVLRARPTPEPTIPVIVALWNRPERAQALLTEISEQHTEQPLRLLLWNNHRKHSRDYRAISSALGTMGALSSIELVSSPINIGGIGRFFLIRKLVRHGYSGPVVMIDDDQVIHRYFIQDLLDRWTPESIVGVWAFRQHGGYWARSELNDTEEASYIGTGGCACDASIVNDAFFTIPDRFSFIEDQWMSYRARAANWTLKKAATPFEFVLQERNQFHSLVELKEEFFQYLYNARPDLKPK